jgi:hypothetical protein
MNTKKPVAVLGRECATIAPGLEVAMWPLVEGADARRNLFRSRCCRSLSCCKPVLPALLTKLAGWPPIRGFSQEEACGLANFCRETREVTPSDVLACSCAVRLPSPQRGEGSCEKIAKGLGMGGRASPRAASGEGLPDNRLARTLALPIFSQLQGLGVRGRHASSISKPFLKVPANAERQAYTVTAEESPSPHEAFSRLHPLPLWGEGS